MDPDNKARLLKAVKDRKEAETARKASDLQAAEEARKREEQAVAFFKNVVYPVLDGIKEDMGTAGVHLDVAHTPKENTVLDQAGRIWIGGLHPRFEVTVGRRKGMDGATISATFGEQKRVPLNVAGGRLEQEVTSLLSLGLGPH